jgi:hypothetical protein
MKGDGKEDVDPEADSNSRCQAEVLPPCTRQTHWIPKGYNGVRRLIEGGARLAQLSLMQLPSTIGVHAHLQKISSFHQDVRDGQEHDQRQLFFAPHGTRGTNLVPLVTISLPA